ncbi:MAG: hypothetical protein GY904_05795 [Planctomycetaceae bacterium]|nr:hypothetical protein [Planctomycetaceae bacterium]
MDSEFFVGGFVSNPTSGESSSLGPLTDDDFRDINEHCVTERYWNQDLAPIPPSARKWVTRDMIALWVALAACIPTYILASSLIDGGMNWWQALQEVGLRDIRWHAPQVSSEGQAEFGVAHWQLFLQSPPVAFIECFKA